jgi:hypothetical protein
MQTFTSALPKQSVFVTVANPEVLPGKQWWNFELEALALPGSLPEDTGDLWLDWARKQQPVLRTIVYWHSSDPLADPPEYTKRADLLVHSQDPAERIWPRIQKLWSEPVTGS